MTIGELRIELETIISGLSSSGFENISSETVEKLEKLAVSAAESGMKEGKRLMENLLSTVKSIREGSSKAESGNVRLTALDFYFKNLPSSEHIEDL